MRGEATPAQIGGFLVALRLKGETADEIAGFAEAMRAHVVPVRPERTDLVDTAGTGGDGAHTLNISTAAALVAAAAGAAVAKHGNRAVSSSSGSADVLEALGFELELSPQRIARSVDELGFGFMFAPTHHPAMRHAAPGPPRAGDAHRLQRARSADEPSGRARAGRRRLRARARADDRRGARAPRRAPRVRRARRGRDRRALPGRPEPRRRGDGRRGARADDRPARARRAALRPGRARRRPDPPRTPPGSARSSQGAENAGAKSAILLNAAGAIAAGGHAADLREGLGYAREALDSGAAADEARAARGVLTRGGGGVRFRDALAAPGLGAIAEIKRRSPSAGELRGDADPALLAARFEGREQRLSRCSSTRASAARSTTSAPPAPRRRSRSSARASSPRSATSPS